eukprot:174497-Chlamydomonas_euryale.AAC.9
MPSGGEPKKDGLAGGSRWFYGWCRRHLLAALPGNCGRIRKTCRHAYLLTCVRLCCGFRRLPVIAATVPGWLGWRGPGFPRFHVMQ